jgi:hypothetical protein
LVFWVVPLPVARARVRILVIIPVALGASCV